MELVGLSPLSSRPAAVWVREQRFFSHGCVPKRNDKGMTTQPSESVDRTTLPLSTSELTNKRSLFGNKRVAEQQRIAASVWEDSSWVNRNFPAWAKQSISFAVCATKALAIDRILRNDSLAGLPQRGKSAHPTDPPGS